MINSFSGKYRFLSNFYICDVYVQWDKILYPSVEHAYQAQKTVYEDVKQNISQCKTPGEAKKLGQLVTIRPDWESVKIDIMRRLLEIKFVYNEDLTKKLLFTRKEFLVEGNQHGDEFWGTVDGIGQNWLGCLLMELRDKLKEIST